MGFDTVSFSSYENMRATGEAKRRCGDQHMEIMRKEKLRPRRGGDDTMAYGVGGRRSSSTPRPIPAQAHDSKDLGNSVGVVGILKAKKGNSEERKRDFETSYKMIFLLGIVFFPRQNYTQETSDLDIV